MTKEELVARLHGIEWEDFEVKEASGGVPKSMWETVSAFSNCAGGWIVLGAKEIRIKSSAEYEIVGVNRPDKLEQEVIGTLRSVSKFNTPILATASKYEVDGKTVLAFYIPPSPNKPVYLNNNLNNTFVRVGSGDQHATDIEIDVLMREKTFGSKSETVIEDSSFEDVNPVSLHTYRQRVRDFNPDFQYNDLPDDEFCDKIGVTNRGRMTFGGMLMFGKRDAVLRSVGHFWIDYLEIPGETAAEAHNRYTYRMPEQDNIWEYFKVLLQRLRLFVDNPFMAGPDGFSPEDNSQLYCLREGLVNLCAHADYLSPAHSTIRVYSNRIEFQNPGRFAIRLENKTGVLKSVPRNPNIIAFFRYARQGENAGYGIDKIRKWKLLTHQEVVFESDLVMSTVTYILPQKKSGQIAEKSGQIAEKSGQIAEKSGQIAEKSGQKITGRKKGEEMRERIVKVLRNDPSISRKELIDKVKISASAIQRHLEVLKLRGKIVRLGSARTGLWKVNDV
jgi:ATP-dependent DNA helicase RecG